MGDDEKPKAEEPLKLNSKSKVSKASKAKTSKNAMEVDGGALVARSESASTRKLSLSEDESPGVSAPAPGQIVPAAAAAKAPAPAPVRVKQEPSHSLKAIFTSINNSLTNQRAGKRAHVERKVQLEKPGRLRTCTFGFENEIEMSFENSVTIRAIVI